MHPLPFAVRGQSHIHEHMVRTGVGGLGLEAKIAGKQLRCGDLCRLAPLICAARAYGLAKRGLVNPIRKPAAIKAVRADRTGGNGAGARHLLGLAPIVVPARRAFAAPEIRDLAHKGKRRFYQLLSGVGGIEPAHDADKLLACKLRNVACRKRAVERHLQGVCHGFDGSAVGRAGRLLIYGVRVYIKSRIDNALIEGSYRAFGVFHDLGIRRKRLRIARRIVRFGADAHDDTTGVYGDIHADRRIGRALYLRFRYPLAGGDVIGSRGRGVAVFRHAVDLADLGSACHNCQRDGCISRVCQRNDPLKLLFNIRYLEHLLCYGIQFAPHISLARADLTHGSGVGGEYIADLIVRVQAAVVDERIHGRFVIVAVLLDDLLHAGQCRVIAVLYTGRHHIRHIIGALDQVHRAVRVYRGGVCMKQVIADDAGQRDHRHDKEQYHEANADQHLEYGFTKRPGGRDDRAPWPARRGACRHLRYGLSAFYACLCNGGGGVGGSLARSGRRFLRRRFSCFLDGLSGLLRRVRVIG